MSQQSLDWSAIFHPKQPCSVTNPARVHAYGNTFPTPVLTDQLAPTRKNDAV